LGAGVTAGYNLQLSPAWLVGVEGDFGYLGGGQLVANFGDPIDVGEKNRRYATLRGRVGYVTGPSLIYVTGGVGFVHATDTFGSDFGFNIPAVSSSTTTTGGVFGVGIETKLSRNWTTKTEYLYIDGGSDHVFQSPAFGFPGTTTNFSHSFQVIKTGLNYRFDGNWDGLPFFNGQMLASNHNWNGFYAGGKYGIGASLTHIHTLPVSDRRRGLGAFAGRRRAVLNCAGQPEQQDRDRMDLGRRHRSRDRRALVGEAGIALCQQR
jgi:outer membrane immunogenic protein